jgi:hypothetical protein
LPRITSEVPLRSSTTSIGREWVTTIRGIFMMEIC